MRFGASEAPTLMGVNPFETLTDLAIRKWSDPEVLPPNAAMERGNYLEPALVTYAQDLLGQPVTTPDEMWTVGRMIATLDGVTADGKIIVECKTTVSYSSDDPCPEAYYWQCVAQLACNPDAESALVVVLDKRMRLGTWTVNRSDDVERLLDKADEVGALLDEHVLPPDAPILEKHVKQLYPSPSGGLEFSSADMEALEAWIAWKAARENAEKEEQAARDRLTGILANYEAGLVDGNIVVTYKARKGSMTVDWKAVARDHGHILDKYRKQGASTRTLRAYDK